MLGIVRVFFALQAFVLVAPTNGNGALQSKTSDIQPQGFRSSTLKAAPELLNLNNDTYELSFVEGGEPLRGTGAHPLYSLDRDDWVSVRDLQVGSGFRLPRARSLSRRWRRFVMFTGSTTWRSRASPHSDRSANL